MAVVQVCICVPVASFWHVRTARSGPLVVLGGFEGQLPSQTKDHRHLHKNSIKRLSSFSIGLDPFCWRLPCQGRVK